MEKGKLTLDKDINTVESIQEHYKKMYSDLPEDVVQMLISTHPLYGDIAKDKSDNIVLPRSSEASFKIKDEKTNNYEEKIEEEEVEVEVEVDEDEDEEEKKFMNSLFSNTDDTYPETNFRRYLVLGLYLGSVVILLMLSVYWFSQDKTNKEKFGELEDENTLLVKQLNAIETENNGLLEKNVNLEKEVQELKDDMVSLDNTAESTPETTSSTITNDATTKPATKPATTAAVKKTYTVIAGDNLWKISQKEYGSGKYNVDIMKANNITNERDIFAGMTLVLPDIKGGN